MKHRRQSFSKKRGNRGEDLVMWILRENGFRCVYRVHDAWKPIRPATAANGEKVPGQQVCVMSKGKLPGDIRAVGPSGESVLVECKSYDGKLQYSKVQQHQRDALDEHHAAGGASYLAWIADHGTYLIPWPIACFLPRKSLSAETAAGVAERRRLNACHPFNQRTDQLTIPGVDRDPTAPF